MVALSLTSFTGLQDDVSASGAITNIAALMRDNREIVHNQAVCALASACLRHKANSAKAASASGVHSLVKLLLSGSQTVQANAILALIAVCDAYEPNRREAARLGACPILLAHKNNSKSEIVRDLSTRLLSVVGVLPSRDTSASSLLLTHILVGETYTKQQAEPVVDEVLVTLDAIRRCRGAVHKAVSAKHLPLMLRLAMHDVLTHRVGQGGGANGSVVSEAEMGREENQGLEAAVRLLKGTKEAHPLVSWADVIQMAAACALEDAGAVPRGSVRMIWGRTDAHEAAPVSCLPQFARGGGVEEGGGEEGEEAEGPVKTRLELALEGVGLSLDEICVLCASMSLGWASPPGRHVVVGSLEASYFHQVQEKFKVGPPCRARVG